MHREKIEKNATKNDKKQAKQCGIPQKAVLLQVSKENIMRKYHALQ